MRYFVSLFFIFLPLQTETPLKGKDILFIIAHEGFKDKEYELPRDIFERLGAHIVVASSDTTVAKGMDELEVKPDTLLSQIRKVDFDAVIFVGGIGAQEYWDDEVAHRVAKNAVKNDKIVGAICIAPITLAKSGILRWKKATVWASPKTKHILKQKRVRYIEKPVVTADKIVTANGPIAAKQFAEEIVRLLLKEYEGGGPKGKRGKM